MLSMRNGSLRNMYIAYLIWGGFLGWVGGVLGGGGGETEFYLMLNQRKNEWSIALLFIFVLS